MEVLPSVEQTLKLRNALRDDKHAPLRMQPPVTPGRSPVLSTADQLEIIAPWNTQILDSDGKVVPIRDLPVHSKEWTGLDRLLNIAPGMPGNNKSQTEEER